MEQLNYEDYKEKPIYVVHEDILSNVLELVHQIIKEKNINMDKYSYIDSEYDRIYHMFYYDVNLCSDIKYLIKELGIEYDTSNTSIDNVEIKPDAIPPTLDGGLRSQRNKKPINFRLWVVHAKTIRKIKKI